MTRTGRSRSLADTQWQSLGSQRYRDSHNGVPYHAIAQLYLVQLTETAPANVVLGETIQVWQWVPAEDVSVFLTNHSVEPFTRLSYRQYSHRLLP